jgi:hypothetical protein
MQQTMRTLAFVCESCVFIYLGLGIFSFPHRVEVSLIGKQQLVTDYETCELLA